MAIMRAVGPLIVFSLAAFAASAWAGASTGLPQVVACDACNEQQRIQAAAAVAKSPGESQIYVVDPFSGAIHLFNVWIDREPGLYHVTVDEAEVSVAARETFADLLRRVPFNKTFELQIVPSVCTSEGTSYAANHVSDMSCQSYTYEVIRNSYRNSAQGWIQGPLADAIAQALFAAPQAPRVVRITVRAPDGSTIEIVGTLQVDIDGDLIITDLKTVRATANYVDLPLRREDLRGRSYSAFNASTLADFRRIFSNWSVDLRTACSSQQRIVCPDDPAQSCVSEITCSR